MHGAERKVVDEHLLALGTEQEALQHLAAWGFGALAKTPLGTTIKGAHSAGYTISTGAPFSFIVTSR